jgi:ABC-type sugar transport system ATPase subunit
MTSRGPTPSAREGREVLAGLYDVEKRFAGVQAVKPSTLELRGGEVHCLIGENGAGKSTLVKMIAGVHRPDAGEVRLAGQPATLRNPNDALRRGVSTVYQELTLVPEMTVAENIALGQEPRHRGGALDRRRRNTDAVALLGDLGIGGVGPRDLVKDLGIAQQQLVEIAKAASREGERVVIMDEPTAVLTMTETDTLFQLIGRLRARGVAILYITHRLEELDEIGDVVTVMRDGQVVRSARIGELTTDALIEAMVGRPLEDLYPGRDAAPGEVVLQIEEKGEAPGAGVRVRRGEVVGLFGLIGAGRTEMVRDVIGADRGGLYTMTLNGRAGRSRSVAATVRAGLAIVPEDRKGQGIVPRMSVAGNIGLSALDRLATGPALAPRSTRLLAERYVADLRIRTPSVWQEIGNLSGGNQQKCLIARALASEPDVVVLDEPTRGIDVGARVDVYRLINKLCDQSRGVLMITSDLGEVIGMSDRIYVMRDGRVVKELSAEEATQELIMRHALGESVQGAVVEQT